MAGGPAAWPGALRPQRRAAGARAARVRERARIERRPPGAAAPDRRADPGWHRGVLGIAASRLAREYHRPVLLFGLEGEQGERLGPEHPGRLAPRHPEGARGSLHEFGGHDQAVGGSAARPSVRRVPRGGARRLSASACRPTPSSRVVKPKRAADEEVGPGLAEELARLEPHGRETRGPCSRPRASARPARSCPVGASGLRGRLRGAGARTCAASPGSRTPGSRPRRLGPPVRPALPHRRRPPRLRAPGRDRARAAAAGERAMKVRRLDSSCSPAALSSPRCSSSRSAPGGGPTSGRRGADAPPRADGARPGDDAARRLRLHRVGRGKAAHAHQGGSHRRLRPGRGPARRISTPGRRSR